MEWMIKHHDDAYYLKRVCAASDLHVGVHEELEQHRGDQQRHCPTLLKHINNAKDASFLQTQMPNLPNQIQIEAFATPMVREQATIQNTSNQVITKAFTYL